MQLIKNKDIQKIIGDNEFIKMVSGDIIARGEGNFDKYCVFLYKKVKDGDKLDYVKTVPTDPLILTFLNNMCRLYGRDKIYEDFLSIYNATGKEISECLIEKITDFSHKYPDKHRESIDRCYTVLYLTMIAEENKAGTKLGKRIKRLGIHQMLFLNMLPTEAADYSKGIKWPILDKLCNQYGF